jgi:hypothetical protein
MFVVTTQFTHKATGEILASSSNLRATGELKGWTENKTIPFKLIPPRAEVVAPQLAKAA